MNSSSGKTSSKTLRDLFLKPEPYLPVAHPGIITSDIYALFIFVFFIVRSIFITPNENQKHYMYLHEWQNWSYS